MCYIKGGECSDSWIPSRGGGGMYGGGLPYPTHEDIMRHHLYHQQHNGGDYGGGNRDRASYLLSVAQ